MSAPPASLSSCGRSVSSLGECSDTMPSGRFSTRRPACLSSQLYPQRTLRWTSRSRCWTNAVIPSKQRSSLTQGIVRPVTARSMSSSNTQVLSSSKTLPSTCTSISFNNKHNSSSVLPNYATDAPQPALTKKPDESVELAVQELAVYEVNELDRCSPMLLSLSKLATDWPARFRLQPLGSLGDVVPFTNKIFDGSLRKRLGITAGMISVMRHYAKEDGLLFEAVYSFYFGDYGHISVKGAYKSYEDTVLTVTGGSGVFTGVYGTVQIKNVEYPILLFYRFHLYGIPPLPQDLQWDTVPPAAGLRPTRTASLPPFALPNFTD